MDHFLPKDHYYLPLEIWIIILELLEPEDWSRFRLVNQYFKDLATPFRFSKISFTFEAGSMSKLEQISLYERLSVHVRKLELCGCYRMYRFACFEEWEESIDLPDDPSHKGDIIENQNDDKLIAHREWSNLSKFDRSALYDSYVIDQWKAQDRIRLSTYLFAKEPLVGGIHRILARFTRLAEFVQCSNPSTQNRWIVCWRRLRFNPVSFSRCTDFKGYYGIAEAIGLLCILRAVGRAKPHLSMLKSMIFNTHDPELWNEQALWDLCMGESHDVVKLTPRQIQDGVKVDKGPSNSRTDDCSTKYSEELTILGNAFEALTRFDFTVFGQHVCRDRSTAARPPFECLCRAKNLKSFRLAFDSLEYGYNPPRRLNRNIQDHWANLLNLLADYAPWTQIVEVKLEITIDALTLVKFLRSLAPTLRRLELTNTTLLPWKRSIVGRYYKDSGEYIGDTWECVLPAIARCLYKLECLNLTALSLPLAINRKEHVFGAEVTQQTDTCDCFYSHKEAVIRDLLQHKELRTTLDLNCFRKQYCNHEDSQLDRSMANIS